MTHAMSSLFGYLTCESTQELPPHYLSLEGLLEGKLLIDKISMDYGKGLKVIKFGSGQAIQIPL